jgi:hypothetical protein
LTVIVISDFGWGDSDGVLARGAWDGFSWSFFAEDFFAGLGRLFAAAVRLAGRLVGISGSPLFFAVR